jgi:rSAM/selenodomain-associated transferase 2
MQISIIIPTYNESSTIVNLVNWLYRHSNHLVKEIIVADGQSMDDTKTKAKQAGATVITCQQKGRAAQMNAGAAKATGNIFYFVHADTLPPASFATDIVGAIQQGYVMGRYRTAFNSKNWLLKINAWFTRFDWFICYGGDQTLFITQQHFLQAGGFNNNLLIMEEFEFTARARQGVLYKIFRQPALISARKYEGRSWLQVQLANKKAVQLYKQGASQQTIADTYKKMLTIK